MIETEIVIRGLTKADLRKAGGVIRRASLPHLKAQGLPDETIREIVANRPQKLAAKALGNTFFVAEDVNRKKIVGVIGLRKDDGSNIPNRLSTFYTDPEYQGKGIGRMLYEKIREEAIKNGCQKLVVSSSPYAESKVKAHEAVRRERERGLF